MFTHRHNGAVGWAVRALVALLAVPTTTVGVSILTHAAPAWAATGLGTGTSFCSSNGGLSSSGRNLDNVYPCANRNINDSFGYQCVEIRAPALNQSNMAFLLRRTRALGGMSSTSCITTESERAPRTAPAAVRPPAPTYLPSAMS